MLTREEKALRKLLQIFMVLFAAAGLSFALAPQRIIFHLNQTASLIAPSLPTLPDSDSRFWVALTVSMMATITALCYGAQNEIRRKKELVLYLLVAKATSTLFFTLYFFLELHSLAYLMGALTDGSIFVLLLIFYKRAARSSQLIL